MPRPKREPEPCQHLVAEWRLVGALNKLRCRQCHEYVKESFGPPESTAMQYKRDDGSYGPFDPKGWLK